MSELVIDSAAATRRSLTIAAMACAVIAVAAFTAMVVTPAGWGVYLVIGLFFLAFATFFVIGVRRFGTAAKLILSTETIRCEDPNGRSWQVEWRQLQTARTDYASMPITEAGPLDGAQLRVPCLELVPADVVAAQGHSDMAHLWSVDDEMWRFPVWTSGNAMEQISRGIRKYRPR